MSKRQLNDGGFSGSDLAGIVRYIAKWTPIGILTGVMAGSASALLLFTLGWATATREAHRWIIALLPLAGLAVGCMYHYFGRAVEAGNNLLLDEIHDPKQTIPARMTPLVLIGTALTHLFGGSAGREGTALQMGASLADQLAKPFGLNGKDRRILLMAGISAGFGSVFGTPLAGAVFGMEVLTIGAIGYEGIAPCFIAAVIGNLTTRAWHIHHAVYQVTSIPRLSLRGAVYAAVAGMVFGLVAMAFARLTHAIGAAFKRWIAWAPLRPFVGGVLVAAAVWGGGTTRYIGLGVPTILEAFGTPHRPWDWAAKLLFTAVTLGAGYKGGEVTPLFFIGATLGNALSYVIPMPPGLLAGMGLAAVFAGASNTPLASTLMAVELFGGEIGAYAGIACVASYLFSGHSGIYESQRRALSKDGTTGL